MASALITMPKAARAGDVIEERYLRTPSEAHDLMAIAIDIAAGAEVSASQRRLRRTQDRRQRLVYGDHLPRRIQRRDPNRQKL